MNRIKYYDHQSKQWKYADAADNNIRAPSALPSGIKLKRRV